MAFDRRLLGIATAGFTSFVNLYSPQAMLPELAQEFHVGAGAISSLMTATTAAIAISAPVTGALADIVGRKRLIATAMFAVAIPTAIMTFAATVPELAFWRFVQGLLLPPIFTVTLAYIGDEWPAAEVPRVAGIYVSGSIIGGFSGRFIPGALTDFIGWRPAIGFVAAITLLTAVVVALMLPRERRFVRSEGLVNSLVHMGRHLRNRRLLATYAIGFGVLFNFVAAFTYVSFHLAGPPYDFTPTMLGALFITYLVPAPFVPWVGRGIARFGRRPFVLVILVVWIAGAFLLLAPPVAVIIAGLTVCAACGMLCQAVSTGYVTLTAKEGRSSAVGLYASVFYIGGSAGAFLTGLAWAHGGWTACVILIVVMQLLMSAIVATTWD